MRALGAGSYDSDDDDEMGRDRHNLYEQYNSTTELKQLMSSPQDV